MRKWILVALVALILLYVFTLREGVNGTLTPTPKCAAPGIDIIDGFCKKPNVPVIPPPPCPAGSTLSSGKCRGSPSMTEAEATAVGLTYDRFVNQYTKLAVDTCPAGYTKSYAGDEVECEDANVAAPVCSSGYVYDRGSCVRPTPGGGSGSPASYAMSSGYADLAAAAMATNQGPLPSAIDARASNTDSARSSSTTGDVFEEGGPFSGSPGTGQGTGAGAAGPLNGNSTYGPPGTTTTIDPYDFWPGTRGSAPPAPAGTKQPVNGPTFGGTGVSIMGGSRATARSEPALYGPGSGNGSGSGSRNSWDISMLPSFRSSGSDPSNQYAATSRVPGDQDFFPPTFAQSSSYSLANGSMKTNPVPVLADFSAFQN
jgi:hypothetical protein